MSMLLTFGGLHAQIEKHIEEANQLAADGKLNEAVALLHAAAKQQEHIWYAHLLKLEALKLYQAAGKLNEYRQSISSALNKRPYDSELLWTMGQAYWLMGDTWNALTYLTRAIGAAPSVGVYYAWLGRAYMELGMEYHADAAFEIALKLDPSLFWVIKELRRPPIKRVQPEVQPPVQPKQPEQPPTQPQQETKPPERPEQPQQPTQPPAQPQPPKPPQPPTQRPYQAELAPSGAIMRFFFKGQLCFINFGFRVAPPGWGWPPLFRQVDMQPTNVKREEKDGVVTFSGVATSAGNSIQWVQTVTQTDEALEVVYELTPLNDIKVESVLIEAWIPAANVADPGRWFVVTGGKPDLKPFPEKPPQGPSPVFYTNNAIDPAGWITRGGAGVLITMEKQPGAFWWLQDDRLYGMGFFEFQFHCGIRNIWPKGKTATLALTVRPFVAEGQ